MKKASPKGPSRVPIAPAERKIPLDARRYAKMATSAHAYVRGTTDSFYEWLAGAGKSKVPQGPPVWVSGDCHVGNLGPIANVDGTVRIGLRDLDQTIVGSPAHDVIRLALSMAMAVRASALPGYVTARLVESIARGYERVLEARASRRDAEMPSPPPALAKLVRAASKRSVKKLLGERIGGDPSLFPIGKRYWPLAEEERAAVLAFFETEPAHGLMTSLTKRPDDANVKVLDAAYWVKGCSSLGLWRVAAIVEVTDSRKRRADKVDEEASLALIDIKEASLGLAPKAPRTKVPAHQGERVVTGARVLSPSLGDRMIPTTIRGKEVFARELLPQDLKFDLDVLGEEEAISIGGYLASVVAEAHARQLESADCAAWLVELRRTSSKNLDAPRWLWNSVVDLVAFHEGAYLEHCREHALAPPVTEVLETPDLVRHKVDGN